MSNMTFEFSIKYETDWHVCVKRSIWLMMFDKYFDCSPDKLYADFVNFGFHRLVNFPLALRILRITVSLVKKLMPSSTFPRASREQECHLPVNHHKMSCDIHFCFFICTFIVILNETSPFHKIFAVLFEWRYFARLGVVASDDWKVSFWMKNALHISISMPWPSVVYLKILCASSS